MKKYILLSLCCILAQYSLFGASFSGQDPLSNGDDAAVAPSSVSSKSDSSSSWLTTRNIAGGGALGGGAIVLISSYMVNQYQQQVDVLTEQLNAGVDVAEQLSLAEERMAWWQGVRKYALFAALVSGGVWYTQSESVGSQGDLDVLNPVRSIPDMEKKPISFSLAIDGDDSDDDGGSVVTGFLWNGALFQEVHSVSHIPSPENRFEIRILSPGTYSIDGSLTTITESKVKDVLSRLYGVSPDDVFISSSGRIFIEKNGNTYILYENVLTALEEAELKDLLDKESAEKYGKKIVKKLFGKLFTDVKVVPFDDRFFILQGTATDDYTIEHGKLRYRIARRNNGRLQSPATAGFSYQDGKITRGKRYNLSGLLLNL